VVSSPLWPAVNAALNLTSALCLLGGYLSIRRGRRDAHQRFMLAAFSCSAVFLLSYLAYHYQVGSVTAPLALATLGRARGGRFDAHRKIARVTFPIWIYVSLTGVVVYLMLYQM
jgi:uncharacterized membrane protein YozB (DUF420 family)